MNKKIVKIICLILSLASALLLYLPDEKGRFIIFLIICLLLISIYSIGSLIYEEIKTTDNHQNTAHSRQSTRNASITFTPNGSQTSKPKSGALTLNSLNKPTPPPTSTSANTLVSASAPLPEKEPATTLSAAKIVEPSDVEKELSHIQKISEQINELVRQIKITEKNKTDVVTALKQGNERLEADIKTKDNDLQDLRDKLHTQSSLRALISIKKFCDDLASTKKVMTTEETLKFITETVDHRLTELDVQSVVFPVGTSLANIPVEQLETTEPVHTDIVTMHNTVARSISPCYYIIADSKKVIVNKALVSLFQFTPPQTDTTTPLTHLTTN